ncbi:YggL family protein [Myxococcus sp. RHSTA-1-4]|uniref:YggL 50S ribosome-binding family protein n=1 Tax=Myxococcus sp. RHSTA-1-4 TaxID=2874601 RepID=UPI001CBEDFAE|nr:50S ribosome-binding protein YggL [Myxococcus sp. RHSTA-1-4]MBZ4417867.1 YggL family protein [Myxococcus sp. RHSTA-1-4]
MNKRLRKKKRGGEFKELGFELFGDLRPDVSDDDIEAFVDRLIVVVEARKLAFGGGGGRDEKFEGFVTRMGRGSATEDDRTVLAAFLAGDDAIVRHEVGALRDAWYQPSVDVEGGRGES